jgi:hypothetical protein
MSFIDLFYIKFVFLPLAESLMNDWDLSSLFSFKDFDNEIPFRLDVEVNVEIVYTSAWTFHLLKIWDLSVKLI